MTCKRCGHRARLVHEADRWLYRCVFCLALFVSVVTGQGDELARSSIDMSLAHMNNITTAVPSTSDLSSFPTPFTPRRGSTG